MNLYLDIAAFESDYGIFVPVLVFLYNAAASLLSFANSSCNDPMMFETVATA